MYFQMGTDIFLEMQKKIFAVSQCNLSLHYLEVGRTSRIVRQGEEEGADKVRGRDEVSAMSALPDTSSSGRAGFGRTHRDRLD